MQQWEADQIVQTFLRHRAIQQAKEQRAVQREPEHQLRGPQQARRPPARQP